MSKHRGSRLTGLIAAPFTPFGEGLELRLGMVEAQARYLQGNGVTGVFVGGTTGECHSLSLDERLALAERWTQVARRFGLSILIHVGTNAIHDAQRLARQAAVLGVDGISCMAPHFYKPRDLDSLIEYCRLISREAPSVPFYFYDIPSMTGVSVPTAELLARARKEIPALAGLKFSNLDLVELQECVEIAGGELDIFFGCDEVLLAALVLGVEGAVGSSYNLAARHCHALFDRFRAGDMLAARRLQYQSVRLIRALMRRGLIPSAKAVMRHCGVDCGAVRPPLTTLTGDELLSLVREIDALAILDPVAPGS